MHPRFYLLPLAYLPLFVSLTDFSFPFMQLVHGKVSESAIGLSFSAVICMAGCAIYLTNRLNRRVGHFIGFALVWLTLSLLAGLYLSPSTTNVMFYIQTILPLLAIPFGYRLIRGEQDLSRFAWISAWTTSVAVPLILLIVLMRHGPAQLIADRIAVIRELELALPQFMSYYPLTVSATFSFALALYLFGDRQYAQVALLLLACHAVFLPLCWSRAGMLVFALCAVVQLVLVMKSRSGGRKDRAAFVILFFAVLLPFVFDKLGSTIESRVDVHNFDNDSDQSRLQVFLEGMSRAFHSPILGDMFIPAWDERLGGQELEIKRLFGTHNQYVDLLLRGGFLYLAAFGLFYLRALYKSYSLMRGSLRRISPLYQVLGCGAFSYLCAIAVASNFQLYFVQLQTAVPAFLVIGVTFSAWDLAAYRERTASGKFSVRSAVPVRMVFPLQPLTRQRTP